jgi:peptide/nickel transport system substrate-binding protein
MAIVDYRSTLSRRRLLGAGGAGLTATAFAACSTGRHGHPAAKQAPSSAPGQPRSGGTMRTALTLNPASVDPQKIKGASSHFVASCVMSRLFRIGSGSDPSVALSQPLENDLAVSAESPDAVTWTVKLRPDARFHNVAPVNGHLVEAEDIIASFKRAITLPGSLEAVYYTMVDKDQIQAPAADTVVFRLKYPYGPFAHLVAQNANGWIVPREALAGSYDPEKALIGSGPFLFDSYTPDVSATFKRNPNWFEQGRPYVDAIQAVIMPDLEQQLAQFTAGKLDELWPEINNVDSAKRENPKALEVRAPSQVGYQIYGHMDSPSSPFQDIRVRQAISLAIDRDAIGKVVFNGVFHKNAVMSSVGQGALAPDQLGAASKYYQYDPAMAKKLLQESGAADQFEALIYPAANYGPQFEKIAQMVNPMLNAVGFKTQLVALDYNRQWVGGGKGAAYGFYPNNQLVIQIWFGAADPADYVELGSLLPDGASNHPRVNDPQLTDMVTRMRATADDKARLQMAQDVQRYIADKMYYIASLPTGDEDILVQPWVQNWCYDIGGPEGALGTETYAKLWLTN